MTWWTDLRARFARPKPLRIVTVIDGEEHTVTEWARRQAAANMQLDPERRRQVEELLDRQYPGQGKRVARERYPEAYL